MAWKLRKDKLKAGSPEAESPAATEPTAAPPPDEAEPTPVFDLSGSAFQPEFTETPDDEPVVPSFLDPEPLTDLPAHTAAAPFFPDPLPEFDPVVALAPDIESEAIAVAPAETGVTEHDIRTEPSRDAIAPGLVTLETETGLPKVAPFILDTPDAPAGVGPPRMRNIVIRIGKLSATHFLTRDVTTIGRPDSVVQNYPDIEIELDDGISRRHAEIRQAGSDYTIVDVGSTNGTLLNGESLTPNRPVTLQPGDRIRVGERTELLFE